MTVVSTAGHTQEAGGGGLRVELLAAAVLPIVDRHRGRGLLRVQHGTEVDWKGGGGGGDSIK